MRFQTTEVTFKLTQGHWYSYYCHVLAMYDFIL